ncbi:MAG: methyltransferase domain-containing protein [Sulfurimonas sp.]|nr:methyltransferase domain-containing protein [Sulfurimonas sp.]MDQ7060541.1 methyltransferase domain-containing protein [Sulfurimonas sp.]
MKISSEFSKYASGYNTYNIIQKKVIDKLLRKLTMHPKNILDLGCGNGALVQAIDWEYKHFVGVDFAHGMLDLHPKSEKIECINGDFNKKELFDNLYSHKFEHIFSASALQWASNLDEVFVNIKSLNAPVSLAIFTSGTFKTLNKTAKLEPLLKDASSIKKLAEKYFDAYFEVMQYKLEFDSVREMFRYIKKSGVSGGRKVLDYKQTKKLMKEYPLTYLEFEIVFIRSFTQ